MSNKVEFSRIFSLNRPNEVGETYILRASDEECQHLANRFELLSLSNLNVNFQLAEGNLSRSYILRGEVEADVVQACVVTLQDVPSHVHSSIDVILLPRGHKIFQGEEDMDPDQDYEPLDGDEVDLGEIAAQYLSLALNSYPRHPSVIQEPSFLGASPERIRPFDVLASLKDK